jgi:hypothetical protein
MTTQLDTRLEMYWDVKNSSVTLMSAPGRLLAIVLDGGRAPGNSAAAPRIAPGGRRTTQNSLQVLAAPQVWFMRHGQSRVSESVAPPPCEYRLNEALALQLYFARS